MTFDNWIKNVKNTNGVDTDGAYGKQCMDLFNDYCHRVLSIDGNTGASCAKKILDNKYVMQFFKRIDNTATFVPQKGDICVWTSGTYGHVAICYGEGNTLKFKTIDQNWQPLTLTDTWHNYTYMSPLVFLRPKDQSNITPTPKSKYTVGKEYKTKVILTVRTGAGTKYSKVPYSKLTKNAQANAYSSGANKGCLKIGTTVTCLQTKIVDNDEWIEIPSGWIAGYYNKQYYVK